LSIIETIADADMYVKVKNVLQCGQPNTEKRQTNDEVWLKEQWNTTAHHQQQCEEYNYNLLI